MEEQALCQLCYEEGAEQLACGHRAHRHCMEEVVPVNQVCFVEECDGLPNPFENTNFIPITNFLCRVSELYRDTVDSEIDLLRVKAIRHLSKPACELEGADINKADNCTRLIYKLIRAKATRGSTPTSGDHLAIFISSHYVMSKKLEAWILKLSKAINKATHGDLSPPPLVWPLTRYPQYLSECFHNPSNCRPVAYIPTMFFNSMRDVSARHSITFADAKTIPCTMKRLTVSTTSTFRVLYLVYREQFDVQFMQKDKSGSYKPLEQLKCTDKHKLAIMITMYGIRVIVNIAKRDWLCVTLCRNQNLLDVIGIYIGEPDNYAKLEYFQMSSSFPTRCESICSTRIAQIPILED